jgi:hypothetical protein
MSAIPTALQRLFQRLERSQADSPSSETTPAAPLPVGTLDATAGADAPTVCARCRRALRRNGHKVRAGRARARAPQSATRADDLPRQREPSGQLQNRNLFRTFSALVLPFVIQTCVASGSPGSPIGGGSPAPMDPPFDAYGVCIRNLPPLVREGGEVEDEQRDCFRQTIQVHHLTLPAGTTADQAFANYKACLKKNAPVAIAIGGLNFNGNKLNTVRESCFTSAVQ